MNYIQHFDECVFEGHFRHNVPAHQNHFCADCGIDTSGTNTCEWYMVRDEVWIEAGMSDKGFLCIGCLERRLGRLVEGQDFSRCALNYQIAIGAHPATTRLVHRLFSGTDNHFHEWVAGVHYDYTFGDKTYGDEQVGQISPYCDCDGNPNYWRIFERMVRRSSGGRLRPDDYDEMVNAHREWMREESERLRLGQ